MLNQFVLIGRLKNITENEIELKVKKVYKDENEEYKEYTLKISISNMFQNLKDNIEIGCVIGVKGCIEENNELVAERVTFLSGKNETE